MPPAIQLSSTNSILIKDINKDGLPDIIAGGNEDNFPPQFGRLDASFGTVLINKGKGDFVVADSRQSGIKVNGIVRSICEIRGRDKNFILFLRNNDFPVLYNAH
jgi:hypothetical protein